MRTEALIEAVEKPENATLDQDNKIISATFVSTTRNIGIIIEDEGLEGSLTDSDYALMLDLVVSTHATWQLYQDPECTVLIPSKILNVENLGYNYGYIKVTAQDGVTYNIYDLIVYRRASSDTSIISTEIRADAENSTTNVIVNVKTAAGATWALYLDNKCLNEVENKKLTLDVGENRAYIKVTAEDQITTRIYTLIVTRAASSACNVIRINNPYGAVITNSDLTVTVPNNLASIVLDITVSPQATWKLYRDQLLNDEIGNKFIELSVGNNRYYIKVTAENGTYKIYSIVISRQALSDADIISIDGLDRYNILGSNIKSVISNQLSSVTIDIVSSIGSEWKIYYDRDLENEVNGGYLDDLRSGTNRFYVKVLAQDGVTFKIHYLDINKALSSTAEMNINPMIPYLKEVIVDDIITGIVDSRKSSIVINVDVSDGATWEVYLDKNCTIRVSPEIDNLTSGANTFYIKVIAEDGTTNVYNLTLYKGSNNNIRYYILLASVILMLLIVAMYYIYKKKDNKVAEKK